MGVYIGSTAAYMRLDSWVMAKIIHLGTLDFCQKFFDFRRDPKGRQFDQTTQAARTIPANIAEGSARHQTSVETELKLLDVARASISETIDDLLTVLLNYKQRAWKSDDSNNVAIRAIRLDPPNYGKDFLYDVTDHILNQKAKFDCKKR
ncbi:MAG: four helix bundle protein, partial [Bacteroidales bacterium]|nr:four helix bundle protein [Bacteroidales bacterium]